MDVLEVVMNIKGTLGGGGRGVEKRHKATLLMLLNCIKKILTTKPNKKGQKATMSHVYE